MGHCCLLIFFTFQCLTLVLILLLFCEKCVAESPQENYESQSQTPPYSNINQGQVPKKSKFPSELSTIPEHHGVWFTSSQETGEPFNKSVFVIPITGILLVITMVLLYIFYTWNLRENDPSREREKPWEEESEPEPLSSSTPDSESDSPPSYLEATTATPCSLNTGSVSSSNPPTYSSIR